MSVIDDVLESNRAFVQTFSQGAGHAPPKMRLAVVTCMDARVQPHLFLGLEPGDAHVIRNGGGRITDDVIRSLVLSSRLLGTRDFMVIHHTDCGLAGQTNEMIQQRIRQESSLDASGIDFLPFADLRDSVREDVRRIRETPLITGFMNARGFIYDVQTGRLEEVPVT